MDDMSLLIGATIKEVYRRVLKENMDYDDDDEIVLATDKGDFLLTASFGSYTGNSKDEYPVYVSIQKIDRKEVLK